MVHHELSLPSAGAFTPDDGGLVIAFDADDTLWHNEHAFAEVERLFDELMAPWADQPTARAAVIAHQRSRVGIYGYGVKSFTLAMIETACQLSDERVPVGVLRRFVAEADRLLAMPTVLIDGAAEAVAEVAESHATLILTKGDLHHQVRRLASTDLAQYCFDIEVVAEKDAATYARILRRHRIDPERFLMVGNSIVSDVAPVLEVGARAVHVPYPVTWALEVAETAPEPSDRWTQLDSIGEVPALVTRLAAATTGAAATAKMA